MAAVAILSVRYCYDILTKPEVRPVFTTWLLFSTATLISFSSYMMNEQEHSLIMILRGLYDFTAVAAATLVTIITKKTGLQRRIDQWCLGVAVVIVIGWLLSGSHVVANLAIQGIIIVGYLPLLAKLWNAPTKTEPYYYWITQSLFCVVCVVVALQKGDFLASIYNARGLVLTGSVVVLLARIDWRHRTRR